MRLPVKVVLPAARCVPTTLLTTRDIHNKAVIESMGMAWDACAPVWPYQACAGDGKFMTSPLWCAMLCDRASATVVELNRKPGLRRAF